MEPIQKLNYAPIRGIKRTGRKWTERDDEKKGKETRVRQNGNRAKGEKESRNEKGLLLLGKGFVEVFQTKEGVGQPRFWSYIERCGGKKGLKREER